MWYVRVCVCGYEDASGNKSIISVNIRIKVYMANQMIHTKRILASYIDLIIVIVNK